MSLSVDQALRKAKRHAKKGELDLAEELYQGVLHRFPNNKRAIAGLRLLENPQVFKKASAAGPPRGQIDGLIALYNEGKLQDALAQGEALAQQYPKTAVVHNILGVVHVGLGRLEDAVFSFTKALEIKPDYAEAHNNIGNALDAISQHDEAIASYAKALEIKPDYAEAHNNQGYTLNELGRHDEAIASCNKALKIKPDYAEAHNNLGNALDAISQHDEAIASYAKALEIKPDFAEAHSNLGGALNKLGRHDKAVASYAKALKIKPDYAEAHNNQGYTLNELGRHDEAIASYAKALQIKPDYVEAHYNLGNAFNELGKHDKAVASYTKALSLNPDRKDYWLHLSMALRSASFNAYNQNWADAFFSLLAQTTVVRPSLIVRQVLKLLKLHPKVSAALKACAAGHIENLVEATCNDLSNFPLFLRIIELCPVPDLELENLLKSLRMNLLLNGDGISDKPGILGFQTSLSLHCFTNEFIFGETKEETSGIQDLEVEIETSLANKEEPDPYKIACLASYRPLHGYQWSHGFPVSEGLKTLFVRHVNEVLEEASIRIGIPCLKEIEDDISSAVLKQYEENPYPRWIHTDLHPNPSSISALAEKLKLRLIDEQHSFSERPDILVAGCGTGQHSLGTASCYANSKVIAVDLSLPSLSYAARKTTGLGITNIEYMQADILDLSLLDKQFDVVESVGVLHHMADPMAGWKVLTDCLKPGGLMAIGLYSELARQHIVQVRHKISQMKLSNKKDDMLTFRQEMLNSDDKNLSKFVALGDFYSTSALRDLLFHVQEHRFTLPQIKASLETLGLTFSGFVFSNENVKKIFKQSHPEPESLFDLDAWHEFEVANPDTFMGMYQFWVQRGV